MPFNRPFENVSNELDLRLEMEAFLSGDRGETSKQSKFLIRRMRRDSNNDLIACACLNPLTKEPDQEHQCPFCLGEGYYWDEPAFVTGYKMPAEAKSRLQAQRVALQPGQIPVFNKIFFIRYDQPLHRDDKIIELKLDSEGRPTLPYKRNMIHRIESLIEYRSDFGRLEFYVLYVNENPSIRVSKRNA